MTTENCCINRCASMTTDTTIPDCTTSTTNDNKTKVDGVKIIIKAGTELECYSDKINDNSIITITKPLNYNIPVGTHVKIGITIFIAVNDFDTPYQKQDKVNPILEIDLAIGTEFKFNSTTIAILATPTKVKIPKSTNIFLPAKTKLYHASTMTKFTLEEDSKAQFIKLGVAKKQPANKNGVAKKQPANKNIDSDSD